MDSFCAELFTTLPYKAVEDAAKSTHQGWLYLLETSQADRETFGAKIYSLENKDTNNESAVF
jgi:hypothetical protein